MQIRNKILVQLFLEDGCTQENDEVSASWSPINFAIYDKLFVDLIDEAVSQWLSENTIAKNTGYEVIFAHCIERDGGGANLGEHFEEVYQESQEY